MIPRFAATRKAALVAAALAASPGVAVHAQDQGPPAPERPLPQPQPQPTSEAEAEAEAEAAPPSEPAAAPDNRPAIKTVFASAAVSFVDLRGADLNWSLVGGGAVFNTSASGTTIAEVARAARPGLANIHASLRHEEQLSPRTRVYLQPSASAGDPLREDWGVSAGVVQKISAQLQLTLDARAARYRTPGPTGVRSAFTGLAVNPGVIITPKGTPLEITAQAIVLRNERKDWQIGGAARAIWYTGDRDLLFGGLSRYPENELGRVRQLTSAYLGVRREVGGGIGLRVVAEHARLQGVWTARTLSLGLEKRF